MKNPSSRTFTLVGAGLGLLAFFAVALLPSLLYGGQAGLMLAGGLFESSGLPTLGVRILVVFGGMMGVTAVASLFMVGGAAVGAAASTLTGPSQKAPLHQ
jgi:hypothetical protein